MNSFNHNSSISSTAKIEPTFYGKVTFFFALAMGISATGAYLSMTYLSKFFIAHQGVMFLLFIVELGLILGAKAWSKKSPLNKIMFALFALVSGVTLGPLLAVVLATPAGAAILTKALAATALMFTATALIGWTTHLDLSGIRGFLMTGLIGMIIVGVFGFFFPWGNTFEMIYSGIGVLLFSGFVAYDFQKLKAYPEDRYIDAALNLYLDIFNLFIMILRFIMSLTNNR